MPGLMVGVGVLLAVLVGGFGYWLFRNVHKRKLIGRGRAVTMATAGFVAAMMAFVAERWVLAKLGIDMVVQSGASVRAQMGPVLGMLLFCVPLEEALKVAIVWPVYLGRQLRGGAIGVTHAVFVATGFAAGEIIATVSFSQPGWLGLVRVFLAVPAHVFFAGLWGYVLGGRVRQRYFFVTFFFCVLIHAIYDHIVFSRGPALLVVAAVMFATMAWGLVALLKADERASSSASGMYSFLEPPTVGTVRRALDTRGRTLKLHWIFAGALVNLGVTLTFLAAAVYLGHRFNVDFALVEEASTEGIVPVMFLVGGLLASFLVSAYLVARASGTQSVLEPAWAMVVSIIGVLALFSVTEPTALVIAVGLAPVGFLLACAGAILGVKRT